MARAASAGQGEVVALRSSRARALAGVAAIASAAAIALGVVAFDARRDLGDLQLREREVAAVLSAPDARMVRLRVTSGGSGTVTISRARGGMVFTTTGLPRLPDARVYELWLMGPDGARPAGLLDRRAGGPSGPVLLRPLDGDQRVGLTVEPAGGSRKPTTRPVLLADLPPA
ncbi:anti-sigma factor [Nonomuraea lactucae]|uniref:anti-sigma factor n=1 Tax=Nonomuraea lactucae TaxID=2249762 RepID=UPI003B833DA9